MERQQAWLEVYGGILDPEPLHLSLIDFLRLSCRKHGDLVAITPREGAPVTYAELSDEVERFAAGLYEHDVRKGDRVALMLPNSAEYVVAFFGIVRLGAIVTQVNPIYTGRELQHILADSGSTVLICGGPAYERAREIRSESNLRHVVVAGDDVDDDLNFDQLLATRTWAPESDIDPRRDLAVLQYTGGTTGVSKGAMLTHANLLGGIKQTMDLLIKDPQDFPVNGGVIAVAPFFHIFGLTMCLFFGVRMGWNFHVFERFAPDLVMELIRDTEPVMVPGVATVFIALHNYPEMESYGLDKVRLYVSGGASVPVELMRSFQRRTGQPIWEGYGLSEGAPVSFNTYLRGPEPGSIGVPIPGTDARVVDLVNSTDDVDPGQPGELLVRGPQVMQGYWNRHEETAEGLIDGWLHTGDIVRVDERGYFFVVDRKKEVVIASGYNIYPREIEEVLYGHPDVVEAVVIGVPDEYRGETVKAFVVARTNSALAADELVEYCRHQLAPYKVPKVVEFRDALPKSSIGKLLKRKLIEEERAKSAGA